MFSKHRSELLSELHAPVVKVGDTDVSAVAAGINSKLNALRVGWGCRKKMKGRL